MAKKINQFDLDEVYRQLRTNIEFSRMDENIQVINTVSTNPNEGKSTIASNLARICADKYRNVLLIDCDLRLPTDALKLNAQQTPGLTNLLVGMNSMDYTSCSKEKASLEHSVGEQVEHRSHIAERTM